MYTSQMIRDDSRRAIAAYKARKHAKDKKTYETSQSVKPQQLTQILAVVGLTALFAHSIYA